MIEFMDDHLHRYGYVYKDGVLNPQQHYQLVEDLSKYANMAGVAEEYIYRSIYDFAPGEEADWLKNYEESKRQGSLGVCLCGTHKTIIRLSAMVGCCLRNRITARITTLHVLLDDLKTGDMPAENLIAIPNFCLGKASGGNIPSWVIPSLMSMLFDRAMKKKMTIISTDSFQNIETVYGAAMKAHIEEYFEIIS